MILDGAEWTVAEMPAREYISRYNRREVFEPMCRACPNWASRWGCTPFDADPVAQLSGYVRVRLYRLSAPVRQWDFGEGIEEMTAAMQTLRRESESKLLDFERCSGGSAMLFTGRCYHCGDAVCSRLSGESCRFPELVRPSLEALGFDLDRTATEVFGRPLEWFDADKPTPRFLTLIGAVFYNPESGKRTEG